MKRIMIGGMLLSFFMLNASSLQNSECSLSGDLSEEEGVTVSKDDMLMHGFDNGALAVSPRQVVMHGIRAVVGLFTPPPAPQVDPEEIEEARKMRTFILANNQGEAIALLKRVGPLCAERHVDGIAAIHMVCFPTDRISMLQLLMQNGVNIETKTERNETPLQIALKLANKPVAEVLVSGGATFGEEEETILEALAVDQEKVDELAALLGKAQQDRLVGNIKRVREEKKAKKVLLAHSLNVSLPAPLATAFDQKGVEHNEDKDDEEDDE
jgi:hypothetical protein